LSRSACSVLSLTRRTLTDLGDPPIQPSSNSKASSSVCRCSRLRQSSLTPLLHLSSSLPLPTSPFPSPLPRRIQETPSSSSRSQALPSFRLSLLISSRYPSPSIKHQTSTFERQGKGKRTRILLRCRRGPITCFPASESKGQVRLVGDCGPSSSGAGFASAGRLFGGEGEVGAIGEGESRDEG